MALLGRCLGLAAGPNGNCRTLEYAMARAAGVSRQRVQRLVQEA
jgi:hypothetical protein